MSWLNTLSTRLTSWMGRSPSAPPTEEELQREEAVRAQFRQRCTCFRRLIAANKGALEAMTALELQLAQGEEYSVPALCGALNAIERPLTEMVRNFDELSASAYPALIPQLEIVFARIDDFVAALRDAARADAPEAVPVAEQPFFVAFTAPLAAQASVSGPKMARLAANAQSPPAGVSVPMGFVSTRAAFEVFMRANGLDAIVERHLHASATLGWDDALAAAQAASDAIAEAICNAPIPQEIAKAFEAALEELRAAHPEGALAVRSSALSEDALENSFAGQYLSVLHVPYADAAMAWKRVLASLYGVTALTYRAGRLKVAEQDQEVMCVGVLSMLDVAVGGVAYSVDPLAPTKPHVVVHAARGSVAAVVDGSVAPDEFRVDAAGGVLAPATPHSGMTEAQAKTVAHLARSLHESDGLPQDVEWAFDASGTLYLLQNRPLDCRRTYESTDDMSSELEAALAALSQLHKGGQTVSPGIGSGPAHCALTDGDLTSFPAGGVLVVAHALPKWAPLLRGASALISEAGSSASHLASVAREYGVPAIFGAQGMLAAVKALAAQQPRILTVLANTQTVYLGAPDAALLAAHGRESAPRERVPQALRPLAEKVFPLHLTDPEAASFAPEGCQTLHDIIRFCHEKSVEALFGTSHDSEDGLPQGKQLSMGRTRLKYWLLDMGGGFAEDARGATVDINQITSLPMLAIWNGLVTIPWAGPPAADGRGFLSIVARSAANPELDPLMRNSMAENNYFLISKTFCNLQTRIGYHFCTVEAEIGNPEHANYASFHFKGGAASLDRRVLRVRFMADILAAHGFHTSAQSDVLFAYREGGSQDDILEKTRILGYLLLHTRQIDMIMHNASMVASLRQKFEKEIAVLLAKPFTPPV